MADPDHITVSRDRYLEIAIWVLVALLIAGAMFGAVTVANELAGLNAAP